MNMSKILDFIFGNNYDEIETYYDDEYFIQIKNSMVNKSNDTDNVKADNFDGFEKTNFGVVSFNNAVMFYVIGNNISKQDYSNE